MFRRSHPTSTTHRPSSLPRPSAVPPPYYLRTPIKFAKFRSVAIVLRCSIVGKQQKLPRLHTLAPRGPHTRAALHRGQQPCKVYASG